MAISESTESVFEVSSDTFANSLTKLYASPSVVVRIVATSPVLKLLSQSTEYHLPKELICQQSPYFAAMFNGEFQERHAQVATLEEMDGVVSVRSFNMLVQWMYTGRVVFDDLLPADTVTAAIELSRLADMCGITQVGTFMAEKIKSVLLANPEPSPPHLSPDKLNNPDMYIYVMTGEHIASASHLPRDHDVRKILASASVASFLGNSEGKFKFATEAEEFTNFSSDLMAAVKRVLSSNIELRGRRYKEPIGGRNMKTSSW